MGYSIVLLEHFQIDWPYSNCRKDISTVLGSDSVYFKKTMQISQYYKRMCDEMCMQYEFIIPQCGCGDPSVPATDTTTVLCNNATTLQCVKTVATNYETLGIGTKCDKYCPTECDSNLYSTLMSNSYYPTNYYSGILTTQTNLKSKFSKGQPNTFSPSSQTFSGRRRRSVTTTTASSGDGGGGAPTNSQIQQSVLSLCVYFEDLRYVSIEENAAITLDMFVGLLGLLFIVYFISFFQLINFLICFL